MMFRSLFFIAPLAASEEQTAMLQLNRRGEVSQHTVNDALVGSLEQSLMSKDVAEKPSPTAMCTYYLKTVHGDSLLQKMSELKGQEKTQQLLQRAMDSVGEQNLRNLEENLMSKDDDKKVEVKESEKKLTPCQVLTELRHAFKHNMNDQREVQDMIKETGKKVGEMVEETVKKSLDAALKVMKEKNSYEEAKKELKEIKLSDKLKEIQDIQKEEVEKSIAAFEEVIPNLKGSPMATTLKTKKTKLGDDVAKYEQAALVTLDEDMGAMMTSFTIPTPTKKDKDGKDVPAAGYSEEDVKKAFKAIQDNIPANEEKAKEGLEQAIEYVKKYIDHVFEKHANNVWTPFKTLWGEILSTDADFIMEEPPKCDGDSPKGCLDIGDDLFWQQASAYLEDKHVESTCKVVSFKDKGHDFHPRKVCDGDHPVLECEDEFLYLAKKAGKNAKEACEKVEATDLPDDTKLSDKEFTDITELDFMKKNDGKTCEKWEKIKDACKSIKKM
jgi:hypothetical protein